MKVIAIFTGYYLPKVGGVERFSNKLATELVKLGYKVIIVTSKFEGCINYKEKNIKVYHLPIYNLFKNRYPLIKKNKEYKKVLEKLYKSKIDFILCQTRFHLTSFVGLKLANKKNIPCMVLEHGSAHFTVNNKMLDFFGEKYEHFLTWRAKKLCDNYFGVSQRCVDWLKHFKISAKGIIYNSIDGTDYNKYKNSFYKVNKNKINICYAGRLIKEKGLYLLCDAFNALKNKYDIELYIAGSGPIYEDLKEKYVDDKIHILGPLSYDSVMSLYNSCDIFVYPSMFAEGLPTSILEAGLMKCAIIATDRGGTVEVINDKKYGFIIKETEEDLRKKLKYLLDNKEKLDDYKENIHNRVLNNFSWKVTAKVFEQEMNRIINRRD